MPPTKPSSPAIQDASSRPGVEVARADVKEAVADVMKEVEEAEAVAVT